MLRLPPHSAARSSSLSTLLLTAAVAAALGASIHANTADAAQTARPGTANYSIGSGALADVLSRFAAAAGVPLAFEPSSLPRIHSDGLQGSYSVTEGFAAILRGTGYEVVDSGGGAYVLRKAASRATDALVLPTIKVRAVAEDEVVDGYVAGRSATGTKTDTPLVETPQSITVVSRAQIEDTGALSLDSALRYATGVRPDLFGTSTRLDGPGIRGAEPSVFLDSLNNRVAYWTSTARAEPYTLERIVVLRGPASMIYGQGSTAGIVNQVSKQPLREAQGEVGLQFGTFDHRQVQADFTGPLSDSGQWLYRMVALGRESGSDLDYSDDDRVLLAPSLSWRPTENTEWTFRLKWQKDRAGGDSGGTYPWAGTILANPNGRIPSDRFFGEPGADRFDADAWSFGWSLGHRFNDRWTLHQNARFTDNKVDYAAIDAAGPYLDAEQRLLNRYGYFWRRDSRTFVVDQYLQGEFDTGAVQHRLLLGVDALDYSQTGRTAYDFPTSEGGTLAPIDIYEPSYDPSYSIPAYERDPKSGVSQLGTYLQDQLAIGPWLGTLGVRHDRVRNMERGSETQDDRETTLRAALGYTLTSGFHPYASYSESFETQVGRTIYGARLEPLRGEQVELGMKYEPDDGRYRASIAAYRLREENRVEYDVLGPVSQAGSTENTGFEVEWVGRIVANLDVNLSYSYLDLDRQLTATPRHRASVWGSYPFDLGGFQGLVAGAGIRYASDFTDGPGTPTTPSVTLLDALIAWDRAAWRIALNATNLTDKQHFSRCVSWDACTYGAPRTLLGTVTRRF